MPNSTKMKGKVDPPLELKCGGCSICSRTKKYCGQPIEILFDYDTYHNNLCKTGKGMLVKGVLEDGTEIELPFHHVALDTNSN